MAGVAAAASISKDDQMRMHDYFRSHKIALSPFLLGTYDDIMYVCEYEGVAVPQWFSEKYKVKEAEILARYRTKLLIAEMLSQEVEEKVERTPPLPARAEEKVERTPPLPTRIERKTATIPAVIEVSLSFNFVVIDTGCTGRLVSYFLSRGASFHLKHSDPSKDCVLTPSTLSTGLSGYKRTYDRSDIIEKSGPAFILTPRVVSDNLHGDGTYHRLVNGGKTYKRAELAYDMVKEKGSGTIMFPCVNIQKASRIAAQLQKLNYCPPQKPFATTLLSKGKLRVLYMQYA